MVLALDKCARGLSPRVRGILAYACLEGDVDGSIPACTGNPSGDDAVVNVQRVYPRVYGESVYSRRGACYPWGLSPRVRGILRVGHALGVRPGSIPACTGNPDEGERLGWLIAVYPRVYGESAWTALPAMA